MAINAGNSFRSRDKLNVGAQTFEVHRLELLEDQGVTELAKLPFSLRILLRSEEHTSELQSQSNLVCRLLLEKKNPESVTSRTASSSLGSTGVGVLPNPTMKFTPGTVRMGKRS